MWQISNIKFPCGPSGLDTLFLSLAAIRPILDCAGVAQTHFQLFWTAQAWPRRTFGGYAAILDCAGVAQTHFRLFWIAQAWPRRTFGR